MSNSKDVLSDYSFYNLLLRSENVRWTFQDIPWDKFNVKQVSDFDKEIAKELAWTELTTYSASRSFLNLYSEDIDFSQWVAVWFYEESKHPFILMKWLSLFGEKFDSAFLSSGREIHPMRESKFESLVLNVISEVIAHVGYAHLAEVTNEEVLKIIYKNLSADEFRHAMGFFTYAKKSLDTSDDKLRESIVCLQLLKYCLYSKTQNHPVREAANRIEHIILKKNNMKSDFTQNMNEEIEKITLGLFSKLLSVPLKTRDDVDMLYRKMRMQL